MGDWTAVVTLALVEGVTEFLPVSSTGHLLLLENTGALPRRPDVFNIVIQSGTAFAVLAAFAGRLRELLGPGRGAEARAYALKLAVAFGVTGAGGLVAKALGFRLPTAAEPVAWATLTGGVLILVIEAWLRGRPLHPAVSWPVAVAMGLGQLAAAVFPGTSRSGATIMAALALGVARPAATEFSFLLGVPTLLAAGALELAGAVRHAPAETSWGEVALGTVVAAVAALAVVRWLLRFVRTHSFAVFGWYRIALGLAILAAGREGS